MKKYCSQLVAALAFVLGLTTANAGTIFYQAISSQQTDASSGISSDNQYTSAVDGGNTRGQDREINGITLYALAADGESATADNCTVNALAGNLSNAGGVSPSIQADGTFKDALSDMTFNNGATDNSQQEIVLDPESLEEGTTYDLRVYICNSSGQNRQVNLSFVGDGQPAVETGFFNEDDARTSVGGFKDANQVYYINYRFIWDGDSTPGITITQKSGGAPFILYALTNQVVPGAGLATQPGEPQGKGFAQGGPGVGQGGEGEGEGGEGEGGDEGLTSGFINQESDEIGVESEEFYGAESLNSNGQWIDVEKWGNCWQPTNVPSGWCPYTNGNWKECDDCGWTFDSEEPWAWATYHYGRWCKVRRGCGWAWVPGKVWGASWVSWRRGESGSSCDSCIGWAPLPPEAGCEIGVGISSWVDNTCDIGPDCYTFVNIRDFGCCPSYSGCGTCIIDRGTYINIYEASINITNICYNKNVNIYCGGPDYNWCNTEIRRRGGKECERIHVNRYDDPGRIKGGKHWNKEGNQLALHSPQINRNRNAKPGKIAEHVGRDKIDKGWGSAKANNKEKQLRNHLAQETKGKTPKNTRGTLPPGVAEKQKQHAGAGQLGGRHPGGKGKGQGQMGAGAGQAAGGGVGQHPGGKGKLKGQGAMGAGAGQAAGGGFNQHPGGRGKGKGQGQMGAGAGQAAGGGFNQHPGKGHKAGKAGAGAAGLGAQSKGRGVGGGQGGQMAGGGGGKGMHPGQKKSQRGQAGMGQAGGGGGGAAAGGGGQHPGKRGGKGGQQFGQGGNQAGGQGAPGGQVGAGGGRGGKGGKHKQQQAQQAQQPAGQQGGFGGAGGGGQKHRKQQQAQQAQQPGGQQGGFGGAGGGGQKHRKQQQAQQAQQPGGQQGGFGGAGGGGQKHRKQQQARQAQQPAGQQGGFGGAGGGGQKHRKQQQAQQFQQPAGQQGGFGGARGGGQKQHRQQQQIQQRQGQGGGHPQPGGQQPQRQGGKKGKKPTPPPF